MRCRSVLLADSHSPILQAVRSLRDDRFDVVVMVANERSLLEAVERLSPEVVVVGVSLPRQLGRNIIAVLHDRFPGLKMIALSAFEETNVANQILACGALAVVRKSSAVTDLEPALDVAISGKTFVSPRINYGMGSPNLSH